MEATVKIFDRPEMENPVYSVTIGEHVFYIQRHEGFCAWEITWDEVFRSEKGFWDGSGSLLDENFLGYNKKEAVERLINRVETLK